MATERLQFHEMGIDDRILKVTNWLTLFGNRERAVYETVWRQLMKENCGEVQESRPEHTGQLTTVLACDSVYVKTQMCIYYCDVTTFPLTSAV